MSIHVVTRSYLNNFSGNLSEHQFQSEIIGSEVITAGIINVGRKGDVVEVKFDRELTPTEVTEFDALVAAHIPVIIESISLNRVQGTTIVTIPVDEENQDVRVAIQNPVEVHISQTPGVGQYTTLSEAISHYNTPGNIFIVHPGTYLEANPITLPPYSTLRSKGTAGNTILIATDQTKDFLIVSPWCKISKLVISGTETPGTKCTGRGVYFDGGVGVGGYSYLLECIVRNFDTCIETSGGIYGSHSLLLQNVQVCTTTAPLTNGLYAHSGGQVISQSFVANGVPVPLSPVALPLARAVYSEGAGTKVSINITSIFYCTEAVVIDDDGEVEVTLLTATSCDRSVKIDSRGTKSKIRAVNFNMVNTIGNDLEIHSQDAKIDFVGAKMDESKILNTNRVKVNATFHGEKGGKNYQAITGDVRIGTVEEPTHLAIGEGKYNVDTFTILRTDPSGVFTDISEESKSESGSTVDMFSGTAIGNMFYIGTTRKPVGMKIALTSAVSTPVGAGDILSEYYDGTEWKPLSVMMTQSPSPSYHITDSFVNFAGKCHVRYGMTPSAVMAESTINGTVAYWCRWRLAAAISNVPVFEYCKMHTNSMEINKDGFMEYFGNSRPVGKLDWTIDFTKPANASPSNQDLYLADNLGVGRTENSLNNNTVDRLGLNEFLPTSIDTSFPLKVRFAIVGSSGTAGDAHFTARWHYSNSGSTVHRSTSSAPADIGQSTSTVVTLSAADTEYRGELVIPITGINPQNENGQPDLMWMTIERDARSSNAEDTYPGNVAIVQMAVLFVKWRDGEHLCGY